MNDPVLAFRRVTVSYDAGHEPAIVDVSFSVHAGERVALVGLNGSGKTTVLMAAVGVVPREGEIDVCGTPLCESTLQEVRDCVGVLFNVPEDQLLFPKVIDDAAFGLLHKGIPRRDAQEQARRMLELLGVGHLAESPLHHLSHGEKQRVALAGALVCTPPLLLLDEPSAALDPPGKQLLARLLRQLDAAILIATHDLEFAQRLCTRFIALDHGRIRSDTPDVSAAVHLWNTHEPE